MSDSLKFHTMPSPPFRPGTTLGKTRIHLVYNCGGIGDYINWTTAIRFTIETNPHITGDIVTPTFFADLAHLWLDDLAPRFRVRAVEDLNEDEALKKEPSIIPNVGQYANACGFSLFSLGFIYYNQISHIPMGWEHLPLIRGDEVSLEGFALPARYAVITPYATCDTRRLPSVTYNEVIAHLVGEGITPVLLGKREIASDHKASGGETLKLKHCIDLREKTTLPEAACIMARAEVIIGLDNGLMHLASCSDAPVLWLFTTVDPKLRLTKRRPGALTAVLTPPESLACRFCNTNMRYIIGHDFKHCIYKNRDENACTRVITGANIIEALRGLKRKREEINGNKIQCPVRMSGLDSGASSGSLPRRV